MNLVVSTGPAASGTFTLQPGTSTVTVSSPGQTGTETILVSPSGGFTGSVALTAAVTSGPSGANDPPVVSFGSTTPVSITGATSGTATLMIFTTGAAAGALRVPQRPGFGRTSAGGAALACVLLLVAPTRRRWRTMLGLLVFLGMLAGAVIGCGGKQNTENTGSTGTTTGNYVVTVMGASGNTTTQTTFTFTVN